MEGGSEYLYCEQDLYNRDLNWDPHLDRPEVQSLVPKVLFIE
jgi:hypothetical protein